MNFYPFIVLFHHILAGVLAILTLQFSTPVIYYRKFLSNKNNIKLSPVLMYYFIFSIIWAILTLINKAYSIVFWRPGRNEYNAFVLYWIGFFPQIFGYSGTVLQIFLCIDRCVSIVRVTFPSKYQQYYCIATLLGLIIYGITFLGLNNSMLFGSSIPTSRKTRCQIFGCFLNDVPYFNISRYCVVIPNAVGGCILFLLIKIKFKSADDARNKRLNNTVIIIIATSTFSEVFPSLLSHIFTSVFYLRLNNIIGPYGITFAAINITISTWLYSKTFREIFKAQNAKVGGV